MTDEEMKYDKSVGVNDGTTMIRLTSPDLKKLSMTVIFPTGGGAILDLNDDDLSILTDALFKYRTAQLKDTFKKLGESMNRSMERQAPIG